MRCLVLMLSSRHMLRSIQMMLVGILRGYEIVRRIHVHIHLQYKSESSVNVQAISTTHRVALLLRLLRNKLRFWSVRTVQSQSPGLSNPIIRGVAYARIGSGNVRHKVPFMTSNAFLYQYIQQKLSDEEQEVTSTHTSSLVSIIW